MDERYDIELDPVSFMTVGTVGPPGARAFYLQAAAEESVVTLAIEKEHAAALAVSIDRLLAMLADKDPKGPVARLKALELDMTLMEPLNARFRVGQLGIGVDEDRGVLVLVAEEMTDEDEEAGLKARFTASYEVMHTLARRSVEVVNAGRPTCALCGEPLGADEHFCTRRNGFHPEYAK